MNNLRKVLVCLLIAVMFLFPLSSIESMVLRYEENVNFVNTDALDGGWLEERDGVKILHLSGSNYEMGYQHGYLLRDEIQENIRAYLQYAEELASVETLLAMWNTTKPYIPFKYITEMQGVADGANSSLENLAVLYMAPTCIDLECFSYAAWSDATVTGTLYHTRSLDFPLIIQDPVTNTYAQENSVLIVRKPDGDLMSICPSIAGCINFYEGINELQVSISVQACWSSEQILKGILAPFRVQRALDSASDADAAIDVLTSNKTLGWNFIVSDAKNSMGYVVETTANRTYVGSWNNSTEGTYPFWKIKNVVRRTNFFIDPVLAATQRSRYNPGGVIGFLQLFSGSPFFPIWRKYKSMSEEIQKNWGDIDLNSSISLLRKVYSGKTDVLLHIFQRLYGGRGILCDFHQWSVCPEKGDFVISFADAESYSHETQLHYFSIYDLLEAEPPP